MYGPAPCFVASLGLHTPASPRRACLVYTLKYTCPHPNHPPTNPHAHPNKHTTDDPKKKKHKPKPKKRPPPTPSLPVRRSTRQRGPPLSSYSEIEAAAAAAAVEEELEEEEEEVDYDDSSVLKYLCTGQAASSAFFGGQGGKGGGGGSKRTDPLKGFRAPAAAAGATVVPGLCDPALSAVYSLHVQPPGGSLLAAGAFCVRFFYIMYVFVYGWMVRDPTINTKPYNTHNINSQPGSRGGLPSSTLTAAPVQ